jgi:protein-tyrosine kinase
MSIIEKAIEKLEQQAQAAGSAKREAAAQAVVTSTPPVSSAAVPPGAAARPDLPLIELPLARLNELGLVTPDRPRSQIAEEFRLIKRPLLANVEGKGAVAIPMPTSSWLQARCRARARPSRRSTSP